MIRTWKLVCLHTLLATLFAAGLCFGDPPANTDKPDEGKRHAELKQSITDLKDTLQGEIRSMRTDYNVTNQAMQRDIQALKDEVARLKTELDGLRNSTTVNRQAGYVPSSTTVPPGTPTGRVELLNTWPGDVSVVLNERMSYRLRPNERVLSAAIPAGTFSYEVIGVTLPGQLRPLAAGQTYFIHVHP